MAVQSSAPTEHLGRGILLTLLAFCTVAVMSALAKAASAYVSSEVIVFFQNSIALVLLSPWLLRGGLAALATRCFGLHVVRAVSGMLSQYLLFLALPLIPLLDATLLSNAAPLFIPLVVWVWLKERVDRKLWLSLAVGFVGIILIIQPGAEVISPGTPLALLAGMCSAIALVSVSQLHRTDPPLRVLFYYFLLSSFLTAPLLLIGWSAPPLQAWAYLVGVGVAMAITQFLLILAYEQASPAALSPFNYSVIVFSGVLGWLVWHEVPNLLAVLGAVLVAAGGILSTMQHPKAHGTTAVPRRGVAPE
jgi:drug/metabolite transporter (DMT)-like permease